MHPAHEPVTPRSGPAVKCSSGGELPLVLRTSTRAGATAPAQGRRADSPRNSLVLLQRLFHVGNAHVEDGVRIVALAAADAARNPDTVGSRVAFHEPVVRRLGDFLRDFSTRVERPTEEVAVVSPELLRILPDYLEVHDWLSHGIIPFVDGSQVI